MTIGPLPTLDDFWGTIESAWSGIDDSGARARLLSSDGSEREAAASALTEPLEEMLVALRAILSEYTSPQLVAWDRHCERVLYDLDREDVHEALEGSDDGFLYARGFVMAAGRAHYDLVNKDPAAWGVMDADAESICYIASHLHEDLFGDWPSSTSISRESCSNKGAWPAEE